MSEALGNINCVVLERALNLNLHSAIGNKVLMSYPDPIVQWPLGRERSGYETNKVVIPHQVSSSVCN